jgi:hydrogenase maturation protein HypF
MTSGNFSGEPIVIDNETALSSFKQDFDAVVTYDRDIYNRVDDSVAMVVGGRTRLLRRSRGWVPAPARLELDVDGIIAAGPDLKNTFAVGRGGYALLGQHVGDLEDYETSLFYEEALDRFCRIFRVTPGLVACDLHPGYHSTAFAKRIAERDGIGLVPVQHHHAHVAAVMAEHALDRQVLGVAFDGTGYGPDGSVWGGEFLLADLADYRRIGCLRPFELVGGDKTAKEPWRSAVSLVRESLPAVDMPAELAGRLSLDESRIGLYLQALESDVGSHLTSSMGRLFDGIAALCGIGSVNGFDAEVPIRFEHAARSAGLSDSADYYSSIVISRGDDQVLTVDWRGVVPEVLRDLDNGVVVADVSARFHRTIALIVVEMARRTRDEYGVEEVVLSGGVFQNAFLLKLTEDHLQNAEFTVYSALAFPANDGGIALGQLAVAAKRRITGCV